MGVPVKTVGRLPASPPSPPVPSSLPRSPAYVPGVPRSRHLAAPILVTRGCLTRPGAGVGKMSPARPSPHQLPGADCRHCFAGLPQGQGGTSPEQEALASLGVTLGETHPGT